MPFISSLRRALSAATLFCALTTAQQCYYPDGTPSSDVPCPNGGSASPCCASDSFCMDNGLCYGGGIVSRGSCTDEKWDSDACGSYCKTVDTGSSATISPCSDHRFACGTNATSCETGVGTFQMEGGKQFLLRADQVASLVSPALSSTSGDAGATVTVTATTYPGFDPNKRYTPGDMAGLACGLGFPLFFALLGVLAAWKRERQKATPAELMYNLPDDHAQWEPKSPAPLHRSKSALSLGPPPSASGSVGVPSLTPSAGERSFEMKGVVDRYDSMKKTGLRESVSRVELEAAPPYRPLERHELASKRMSADVK